MKHGAETVRRLLDGTVVTVKLEGAEPQMAVTIPRAALLADQQGPYVFIVDKEDRGQVRRVKLGQGTADIVAIEMLAAGQGIEFHRPQKSSRALELALGQLRAVSPHYDADRPLARDIEAVSEMILAGKFTGPLESLLFSFAT